MTCQALLTSLWGLHLIILLSEIIPPSWVGGGCRRRRWFGWNFCRSFLRAMFAWFLSFRGLLLFDSYQLNIDVFFYLAIKIWNIPLYNSEKMKTFYSGSYYILDRAYNNFKMLYRIHQIEAYFVIRAKKIFSTKLPNGSVGSPRTSFRIWLLNWQAFIQNNTIQKNFDW